MACHTVSTRRSASDRWSDAPPAGYSAEFSLIATALRYSLRLPASPPTHCRRAAVNDRHVLRRCVSAATNPRSQIFCVTPGDGAPNGPMICLTRPESPGSRSSHRWTRPRTAQGTGFNSTARQPDTRYHGAGSSERPKPAAHWRNSCRKTPAFIGCGEAETSHRRRPASSPELEGGRTNNTASRECVPIR
jgi:hypothetical protein